MPSIALKIGYGLRKFAAEERGNCLRKGNLARNKKIK